MMVVAPAYPAQAPGASLLLSSSRRPFRSVILQGFPSRSRLHGETVRCRAADGANRRPKTGRQQRRDAADTAKRGVDDAADNLKAGIQAGEDTFSDAADSARRGVDSAQDALDDVNQAFSDAAADTRRAEDDVAENLKDAVRSAEEAAGSQRKSVRGTSENIQQGIDSAADSAIAASRQAEQLGSDPEQALDDTSDAANRGIDSAAEAISEGVDQAREYVEDPKAAVSDVAGAAEEGVDSLAENLKEGVRTVQQGVTDAADAAEETAEDVQAQSQPRIGARPLTVTYASGTGITVQDTTTSGGSVAAQQAGEAAEDAARQVDQGVDEVATAAVSNIDEAAEQAQGFIGAAQERVEGAFDEAPRQAASVVQQAVDSTADTIKQVNTGVDRMQTPPPAAPFSGTPLTSLPFAGKEGNDVEFLKKRLLYSVAGLDRGFAASAEAQLAVETAIYSLVGAAGGSPPLTWTPRDEHSGQEESTMALLSGTWRLVYSSGFASSGSLGGLRPGPQAALLPITIGQVYQVISGGTATLDNVVEFYVRYSLPRLPGLPEAEPAVATLRLRHSLEILSNSTVQITFEDTEVKTTGGLGGVLGRLPELTLPQLPEPLKPSRALRSSTFEVIYLDSDLRITRGDRGELRAFVRT